MRGGDESRLSLKAKEGARVSWLPPAATLFHAAAAGTAAPDRSSAGVCDQALEISATGKSSLVFTAKPGVPCRGSRVRQRVRIGVETGCELLYLEYWTVGRAAGGELWRFDWIDADLEYREGDRLQYAEKWRLSRPMEGPALLAGCPMWATGIAHGDRMEELLRAEMEELRGRGGEAEIGRLGEKSWLLKARSTQAWDPGFNP
jgi:urease accessory protein UreH